MIKKKTPAKRPKNRKSTGLNSRTKSTGAKNKNARKIQGMDPDRLALSKNDILEFCDRVIKKWQQDTTQNTRNLPAMFAVRTGVLFSDEVSLGAIWSEIISWVYQLLYENAQAQARDENQEWAKTFAKIKSDKMPTQPI
jgi:hypothetical protein